MKEPISEFIKRLEVKEVGYTDQPSLILTVNEKQYPLVTFVFRAIEDLRERVEELENVADQHSDAVER